MRYDGACHCGRIKLTLTSDMAPEALGARACQCSFCRQHGASWTSDSTGSISIKLNGPVSRYRFGTESAEFLVCERCGVVPAVVWQCKHRGMVGVARVECMDAREAFQIKRTPADFEGETLEARYERRSRNWTPVEIGSE